MLQNLMNNGASVETLGRLEMTSQGDPRGRVGERQEAGQEDY